MLDAERHPCIVTPLREVYGRNGIFGGRGGGEGVGLGSAREESIKVRGPPVAVSGASRRTAIGPPCAPSRVLWGRFVEPHRTLVVFCRVVVGRCASKKCG